MYIKGKWYSESEVQAYVDKLEGKIAARNNFIHCVRSYYQTTVSWVDLFEEDYNKLAGDIDVPTKSAVDNNVGDKIIALEPEYEGDGYDDNGEIVYDAAYCPICHQYYELDYDDHDNYCRNCGQKLDWRRVETGGGNE